jgi:hypothetical protein
VSRQVLAVNREGRGLVSRPRQAVNREGRDNRPGQAVNRKRKGQLSIGQDRH